MYFVSKFYSFYVNCILKMLKLKTQMDTKKESSFSNVFFFVVALIIFHTNVRFDFKWLNLIPGNRNISN